MKNRRILCFGTFDGLDAGHRFFLEKAAALGSELYVSVARDKHVQELKKKSPLHSESQRMKAVGDIEKVTKAVLSDEALGSFAMIEDLKPDLIGLGFDQDTLADELDSWMQRKGIMIPVERISLYE